MSKSVIFRLSPRLAITTSQTLNIPLNMKKTEYYLSRALRLARLPRSKNIMRKMAANHRAMGAARQLEIASYMAA